MLKYNLKIIEEDLSKYKRDTSTLLEYYISERLSQSLRVYYKELSNSVNYLNSKDECKIAKRMNKEDN